MHLLFHFLFHFRSCFCFHFYLATLNGVIREMQRNFLLFLGSLLILLCHALDIWDNPCYFDNPCDETAFCFTVPNEDSTTSRCGCHTSMILNPDNVSCSEPQNFLVYSVVFTRPAGEDTQIHRSEIQMIPLDGELIDNAQVLLTVPSADVSSVAYDFIRDEVYWTEEQSFDIKRSSIVSGSEEVFINWSRQPNHLAIDPYSKNIYWADALNRVLVARMEDPSVYLILYEHEDRIDGLAVDYFRGYIFFSLKSARDSSILKSALNGAMEQNYLFGDRFLDIAIDPATGLLYYTMLPLSPAESLTIGTPQNSIIDIPGLGNAVNAVAVNGDYIYWTNNSGTHHIWRANKTTGSTPFSVFSVTDDTQTISGLSSVNATRFIDVHPCNNSGCSHFCFLDASNHSVAVCGCTTGVNLLEDGMTCDRKP